MPGARAQEQKKTLPEKPAHGKSSPQALQLEKACRSEDPAQSEINKMSGS